MKMEQLKQSSYQKNSGMNLSDIADASWVLWVSMTLRVQVDELKVRAWAESLDSDLTITRCKENCFLALRQFDTSYPIPVTQSNGVVGCPMKESEKKAVF
jgi:hypothetical protein